MSGSFNRNQTLIGSYDDDDDGDDGDDDDDDGGVKDPFVVRSILLFKTKEAEMKKISGQDLRSNP